MHQHHLDVILHRIAQDLILGQLVGQQQKVVGAARAAHVARVAIALEQALYCIIAQERGGLTWLRRSRRAKAAPHRRRRVLRGPHAAAQGRPGVGPVLGAL
eukprot:3214026-Prymnesium_polylepis.2